MCSAYLSFNGLCCCTFQCTLHPSLKLCLPPVLTATLVSFTVTSNAQFFVEVSSVLCVACALFSFPKMDGGPSVWDWLSETCNCCVPRHRQQGRIALSTDTDGLRESDSYSLHTSASTTSLSVGQEPGNLSQAHSSEQQQFKTRPSWSDLLLGCISARHRPSSQSILGHSPPLDDQTDAPVASPPAPHPHMHVIAATATPASPTQSTLPQQSQRKKKRSHKRSKSKSKRSHSDQDELSECQSQFSALDEEDDQIMQQNDLADGEDLWITSVVVDPSSFASPSLAGGDSAVEEPAADAITDDAAAGDYMLRGTDGRSKSSRRSHARQSSTSTPYSSSAGSGRRSVQSAGTAPTSTSVHHYVSAPVKPAFL